MQWMQFAGTLRKTVIKYGCLVNIYVMDMASID
ncbi:hypothetical protein F8Y91_16515 [Vibrio alginolyticus]|nr:hypothetical protein [Vibrio alginolyticus]EGR0709537.1 hypothetical protein [Vibrio alginolyticus]